MEAYSSSSSSSSTTYLSLNSQETKKMKQAYPFQSSLHSVRKSQVKPWKKPIAPLPPTPPRVYKVESANFREVVQQLTGAPEFQLQSRRLQSVAPPPLNLRPAGPLVCPTEMAEAQLQLFSSPVKTPLSALYKDLMNDTLETKAAPKLSYDSLSMSSPSPLGFTLSSPSSFPWCSFPLLSPGTLSALEQSTVL